MLEDKGRSKFSFRGYCEFSLLFIEANDKVFYANEFKDKIEILVNPDLNLTVPVLDEKKKD